MTAANNTTITAVTADITETAAHCMRATAELQSRLAASWLEIFTLGVSPRGAAGAAPAMVNWSLEAMRLTAETTLRNIERCQDCAQRAGGGKE